MAMLSSLKNSVWEGELNNNMILEEENPTKHFDTLLPLFVTDAYVCPSYLGGGATQV